MAQNNNDDVARALAALAGGAVPSEHETPSGGIPSETTVFSPEPATPPLKPLFNPGVVPAAPPARPAAISRPAPAAKQPRVATPVPKVPPMPTVPPPAKIRSSTTSKRPASPNRPAAPTPSINELPASASAEPIPSDDFLSEITDDDDVIVPAPDISAFTPKVRQRVAAGPRLYEQVNFRRTLIPILLTGGLELLALGTWSAVDHNGLLGRLGSGIAITLIVVGVVLLGLAALNMLQVREILSTDTNRK